MRIVKFYNKKKEFAAAINADSFISIYHEEAYHDNKADEDIYCIHINLTADTMTFKSNRTSEDILNEMFGIGTYCASDKIYLYKTK